jgi:LL-diaminopimelate aminotransferase
VHNLPLTESNHFLPDLEAIPAEVLKKAKVLVINYPNNPTERVPHLNFTTELSDSLRNMA